MTRYSRLDELTPVISVATGGEQLTGPRSRVRLLVTPLSR
jgi:hypothetical protein